MTEINDRGNEVFRGFSPGDRYQYDFGPCSRQKGWTQYDTDQDAHYFGVWVHVKDRMVFTYCEGDTILVKCPSLESFRAELSSMAEFYGDPPPAMRVIDADGSLTEVYDPDARPEA